MSAGNDPYGATSFLFSTSQPENFPNANIQASGATFGAGGLGQLVNERDATPAAAAPALPALPASTVSPVGSAAPNADGGRVAFSDPAPAAGAPADTGNNTTNDANSAVNAAPAPDPTVGLKTDEVDTDGYVKELDEDFLREARRNREFAFLLEAEMKLVKDHPSVFAGLEAQMKSMPLIFPPGTPGGGLPSALGLGPDADPSLLMSAGFPGSSNQNTIPHKLSQHQVTQIATHLGITPPEALVEAVWNFSEFVVDSDDEDISPRRKLDQADKDRIENDKKMKEQQEKEREFFYKEKLEDEKQRRRQEVLDYLMKEQEENIKSGKMNQIIDIGSDRIQAKLRDAEQKAEEFLEQKTFLERRNQKAVNRNEMVVKRFEEEKLYRPQHILIEDLADRISRMPARKKPPPLRPDIVERLSNCVTANSKWDAGGVMEEGDLYTLLREAGRGDFLPQDGKPDSLSSAMAIGGASGGPSEAHSYWKQVFKIEDDYGTTLLMQAAKNGWFSVVNVLLNDVAPLSTDRKVLNSYGGVFEQEEQNRVDVFLDPHRFDEWKKERKERKEREELLQTIVEEEDKRKRLEKERRARRTQMRMEQSPRGTVASAMVPDIRITAAANMPPPDFIPLPDNPLSSSLPSPRITSPRVTVLSPRAALVQHHMEVRGLKDGSVTPLVPLTMIKIEDVVNRLEEMKRNSVEWTQLMRMREQKEHEENQSASPRTPREIHEIMDKIRVRKSSMAMTGEELQKEDLIKQVIREYLAKEQDQKSRASGVGSLTLDVSHNLDNLPGRNQTKPGSPRSMVANGMAANGMANSQGNDSAFSFGGAEKNLAFSFNPNDPMANANNNAANLNGNGKKESPRTPRGNKTVVINSQVSIQSFSVGSASAGSLSESTSTLNMSSNSMNGVQNGKSNDALDPFGGSDPFGNPFAAAAKPAAPGGVNGNPGGAVTSANPFGALGSASVANNNSGTSNPFEVKVTPPSGANASVTAPKVSVVAPPNPFESNPFESNPFSAATNTASTSSVAQPTSANTSRRSSLDVNPFITPSSGGNDPNPFVSAFGGGNNAGSNAHNNRDSRTTISGGGGNPFQTNNNQQQNQQQPRSLFTSLSSSQTQSGAQKGGPGAAQKGAGKGGRNSITNPTSIMKKEEPVKEIDYKEYFGFKNLEYNIVHFQDNTDKLRQLQDHMETNDVDKFDFSPRKKFKIPQPTKNYVNKSNSMGWTALLLAAQCGYTNICEILLNNLADINCCSRTTMLTPLMLAASSGTPEMVELLLKRRADIWKTNVNKQNVIEIVKNKRMVREQELKFSKMANVKTGQVSILHDAMGRNVDMYIGFLFGRFWLFTH